ncbi:hypothetical protein EDB82DRAFT_292083 [Fusarium venenatum]|uniref:uncharacterized protein n=1 Tax=Fusarium venenatum TaxID=56646 RepID=UPI001D211162|nr:hypothetical protein EDB82DRAFT_292083 [Fusarium venenatum]
MLLLLPTPLLCRSLILFAIVVQHSKDAEYSRGTYPELSPLRLYHYRIRLALSKAVATVEGWVTKNRSVDLMERTNDSVSSHVRPFQLHSFSNGTTSVFLNLPVHLFVFGWRFRSVTVVLQPSYLVASSIAISIARQLWVRVHSLSLTHQAIQYFFIFQNTNTLVPFQSLFLIVLRMAQPLRASRGVLG